MGELTSVPPTREDAAAIRVRLTEIEAALRAIPEAAIKAAHEFDLDVYRRSAFIHNWSRVQDSQLLRLLAGLALQGVITITAAARPESEGEQTQPDCEWFAWIGQSFAHCDHCGRPAWEHKGEETFPNAHDPFSDTTPVGRPWEPGEADAIRAKWGGSRAG